MSNITYVKGDATQPIGTDNKIIIHICNDLGGWGKGFVLAISKRWKTPEQQYREWYSEKDNFKLGETQIIQVEDFLFVGNMIAQEGIRKKNNNEPIRYDALENALKQIAKFAIEKQASVHMPRLGCGLAGGKWEKIEPLISKHLISNKIETTVYDFG